MRGQLADLRPLGLNALDPHTEPYRADFLPEDHQRIATLDGEVDQVGTPVGKDRQAQPVAVMQGLAPHQKHRGEEIPHTWKFGGSPGLFLPREAMTGEEGAAIWIVVRAKEGVAQVIPLGHFLVHVKPRGDLSVDSSLSHVLRLIVP